jgi:serine/threonine protein kinase
MSDEDTQVDGEPTRTVQRATPAAEASPDAISDHRRQQVFRSLFAKPVEPVRFDRFVLLESIGAGGMGELYLAHDEELDRKVALKIVR